MKLSKSSQTKLKNKLEKVGKEIDVKEDGTVFYYEDDKHKQRLERRAERKKERIEARRSARKSARIEARKAAKG